MPVVTPLLAHEGAADESIALTLIVLGGWTVWVAQDRLRGRGFARMPRAAAWTGLVGGVALVVGGPVAARSWFGPVEPAGGPRPGSTAQVEIVAPRPGTTITGGSFRLAVELEGGVLIDGASTDLRPNTGHLHVTVDDRLLSMTGGLDQEVDASGLDPGTHSLTVEYVAADHGPFSPRVAAGTTFVVP